MLEKLLTKDKKELFDSLNYMKMEELKVFCDKQFIPTDGKKGVIIRRIKHYLITGKIVKTAPLPEKSKAKKTDVRLLKPTALILSGLYKNDDETRAFMKKLVGKHFHFTSYGQDWIKLKWEEGLPPTYAQFAKFWQDEFLRRKSPEYKACPKDEWAYLNFLQRYLKLHPNASRNEMASQWNKIRNVKANNAIKILMSIPT